MIGMKTQTTVFGLAAIISTVRICGHEETLAFFVNADGVWSDEIAAAEGADSFARCSATLGRMTAAQFLARIKGEVGQFSVEIAALRALVEADAQRRHDAVTWE